MKRVIGTLEIRRYTVTLKVNQEAAYPREEWAAIRGKLEEDDPRIRFSIFTHRTIATSMDDAILQAKQKRGLEALLQRINEGKKDAE